MVEENLTPDQEQEGSNVQGTPPPDDTSQEESLEEAESALSADENESPDMAEAEVERLMLEELEKSEAAVSQPSEDSSDDVSEDEAERQMMAELLKVGGKDVPEETVVNHAGMPNVPVEPAPIAQMAEFGELTKAAGTEQPRNIEILMDVKLPISIELGRTEMTVNDILELASGSVVELDKLAGESVDLLVNNKVIARGEVVVVDENFGLRITNLLSAEERIKSL